MNEEEAFIRAIVDSPGDDLPRLVYADWLDDRDDPRGAYLRAEREAIASGDTTRLKELAAGLDPVWVARVSRPPLGVCCEHLTFTDCGPSVNAIDVDAFERANYVQLPLDYRAFLLNLNGGRIQAGWFPTPGQDEGNLVGSLYALDSTNGGAKPQRGRLEGEERFGDDARPLLPIGYCNGSLDWLLLLDLYPPTQGEVLLFEDYADGCLIHLTDTFAQFLSIIEPHGFQDS